jgi:streptogramin lyase
LAVDSDGSVLLVVSKSVMAGFGGIVYRITKPGEHVKLYSSDPNSTPNGIAVGSSGRIYVAATGANALVVLDKNGTVVQKIASPSFSKPFGLAWRGHSLLLTNQTPAAGDDPSSWSVLRAATEDSAASG